MNTNVKNLLIGIAATVIGGLLTAVITKKYLS